MGVLHLGYLFSCNIAPNRRFSSRSAIKDFLDNIEPKGGDNAAKIKPIYIDEDNAVGGYTLDVTKRYFDTEFENVIPVRGYNYGLLYAKPSSYDTPEDIPALPTVVINAEWLPTPQAFFFFVTSIEHNSIDSDFYRVYYTIDWWTTCIYLEYAPTIEGEALRAHVNDINSLGNPIVTNFTDEAEMALPQNSQYTSSRVLSHPLTIEDNGKEGDFAFLVMAIKNPSIFKNYSSTWSKLNLLNTNYKTPILPATIGITVFTPIRVDTSGSPLGIRLPDEGAGEVSSFPIDEIVDDRIISMYITQSPPCEMDISIINEKMFNAFASDPAFTALSMQYADGKYMKVFEYKTPEYGVMSNEYKLLAKSMGIYERTDDLSGIVSMIKEQSPEEGFIGYLNNLVVKAHLYPYCYASVYSSGKEIEFNQTYRELLNYSFVRIPADGTYVLFNEISHSYDLSDPRFTSYFYNTGIFAPFFSENWLQRLNSLDEAAHSKERATANAIITPITGTVGALGDIFDLDFGDAASGLAKTIGGTVMAGMDAAYATEIADRTIQAVSDGYLQNGSVPSQSTVGLCGDDRLYLIGKAVRPALMQSLCLNLHLYGTTTKINLYYLLSEHKRQHFNFYKSGRCNVIPVGNNNFLSNATFSAEIINDIRAMFMNGVWLIHDHYAERSLLISNLPEGV